MSEDVDIGREAVERFAKGIQTIMLDGRLPSIADAEDAVAILRALRDALDRAEAECGEWRPEETAPKDGSLIIIYTEDGVFEFAYWRDEASFGGDEPCAPGWQIRIMPDSYDNEAVKAGTLRGWMPAPRPPQTPK